MSLKGGALSCLLLQFNVIVNMTVHICCTIVVVTFLLPSYHRRITLVFITPRVYNGSIDFYSLSYSTSRDNLSHRYIIK